MTVTDAKLTVTPEEITKGASGASIILGVAPSSAQAYKLPTEITGITVNGGTVNKVEAGVVEEADGFTYSAGQITIGSNVTIDGAVEITAAAVEKSTDVTLSDLTYSGAEGPAITLEGGKFAYTVELTEFVADETSITLTPTVTATGLATASETSITYSGIETEAKITVTAENTTVTQEYTITFKSKDKLATVERIDVAQLSARYSTSAAALEAAEFVENATVTQQEQLLILYPSPGLMTQLTMTVMIITLLVV